ncbi:MAG: ATP-binding protein [Actinomycetota bacterium]
MRPPRTLAGRLVLWQLTVILSVLLGIGLVLDRVFEREFVDGRNTVRVAFAIGLLVAAAATTAGVLLVVRGVSRPLRRATESLARHDEGNHAVRVEPEGGPDELAVLASTVNRMAERLEEQIRSARGEQRTRDLILSSMEEGILLAAPDGRVRFANPAIEGHLGGRPGTLATLTPLGLREAARRATQGRIPVQIDVETGTPARSLRGAALPVGNDGSVLLVLRDVTEAKRLDAVRRDFVANASHELKTPAASIQAAAETIRTAVTDDPGVIPRFAEQLEKEALRLSRIVSDLLDLSRLESGSDLTEIVSLDELLREEVGRLEEIAADAGVSLNVRTDGIQRVRGSARDLSLLVRNLLDNAIRYTRPGGKVDVSLASEDARAVLRVADTGVGIPSRDLPRIFERFYRVDRARSRETGGTGLGLSIVRHIVENHGGTVNVSSALGRGTTLEVRLPGA